MIGKPAHPGAAALKIGTPTAHRGRTANFYALPFASQMVVWAARKHLHALASGRDADDDALEVFHVAGWGGLLAALLALTDILAGTARRDRLALHAASCPCLAPHEAYLLNALAHLQEVRPDEAILCLCEIVAPAGARLAMPHLKTIVREVSAQQLRFVHVDLTTLAPPLRGRTGAGSLARAH